MYDVLVSRHQEAVKESAERSNAIISSLFPAQVRDRLLAGGSADAAETKASFASPLVQTNNMSDGKNRGEGDENAPGTELLNSRPIADLFANCTVLFAGKDIYELVIPLNNDRLPRLLIPHIFCFSFYRYRWFHSMVKCARATAGLHATRANLQLF